MQGQRGNQMLGHILTLHKSCQVQPEINVAHGACFCAMSRMCPSTHFCEQYRVLVISMYVCEAQVVNWVLVPQCLGLTSEDEDQDFLLEASQGDRISGKISRKEVAAVAVTALGTGASVGEWHVPSSARTKRTVLPSAAHAKLLPLCHCCMQTILT